MEADDVLADQMQVRRPEFPILLGAVAVSVITDAGDVVGQRIHPHEDRVLVVEIHGNAPFYGGSRHTQILQTRKKEVVHHLILAGHWLNELRMGIDVIDQLRRVLTGAQEIRLLAGGMHFASAVGTFSVLELGLGPERLARRTVHSVVLALVDVALVVQSAENLLHLRYVVIIRGADEFVVGHVQLHRRVIIRRVFRQHILQHVV